MGLDVIPEDLVHRLGKEAVTCSAVTECVRNARFALKTEVVPRDLVEGGHGPVHEAILAARREYPFSSVRELSRLTCLPRSTGHGKLTQSLRHLRWVPHFFTAGQKRIRVDIAGELLRVLSSQMTHQWYDIVTLDQILVCLCAQHEMMQVSPGERVPDRERRTTLSLMLMLTIGRNPSGFHIVKSLRKGTKFNGQYSVNNILVQISDWPRGTGRTRPKKLWVHADNARPRTAKVSFDFLALNEVKKVRHPSYSFD
jgi:hypothetical protein